MPAMIVSSKVLFSLAYCLNDRKDTNLSYTEQRMARILKDAGFLRLNDAATWEVTKDDDKARGQGQGTSTF